MSKVPNMLKLHCQNPTEAKHAQELLAMEEEARIRRSNLLKRIDYEHCVEEQQRQDVITDLKKEIHGFEKQILNQTYQLEKDNGYLEGQLNLIEDNTQARTAHLQMCHDIQVERLGQFMDRLQVKINDMKAKEPKVNKDIKTLEQEVRGTEGKKNIMQLEERLEKARNKERQVNQQCFETEKKLRDKASSVNIEEIQSLEVSVRNTQATAKAAAVEQEDTILTLNLDNFHLGKEIAQVVTMDAAELAEKEKDEIRAIKNWLDEEEITLAGLKRETEDMKDHFKILYENKLQAQANRNRVVRNGLILNMEQVNISEKEIITNMKNLPSRLKDELAKRKAIQKERMKMLDEQEAEIDKKMKLDIKSLRVDHANEVHEAKDKLHELNTRRKKSEVNFEQRKNDLEKSIDAQTKSIPDLLDAIDHVDRDFAKAMSSSGRTCKLACCGSGGEERLAYLTQVHPEEGEDNTKDKLTDFVDIDGALEATLQEIEDEIEQKAGVLQDLFQRHRGIATDTEFMDRKVRIATRDLRNETNHLKYKMRCLRTMIREQNYIIDSLHASANQTELDLKEMMNRAQNAIEEEKERLHALVDDEERLQSRSCEQMDKDIESAMKQEKDMMADHKELLKALAEKQDETRETMNAHLSLEKDLKMLGSKISELDTKMNDLVRDHDHSMKEANRLFVQHMDKLASKRKSQEKSLKQQKKLRHDADKLEKMIASLDNALESTNQDNFKQEAADKEMFTVNIGELSFENDRLASALKQLRTQQDQEKETLSILSSLNLNDVKQHQTLHANIHSDMNSLKKKNLDTISSISSSAYSNDIQSCP